MLLSAAVSGTVQLMLPVLPFVGGQLLVYLPTAAAVLYGLAGCWSQARTGHGRVRAGWWAAVGADALLSLAYLLVAAAAVLGRPALVDLAGVVAVPAALAAVVMLWLHANPPGDRFTRLIQVIDVTAVASAFFVVAWQFVLGPVAATLPAATRAPFVALMLPDLFLLAAALVLVSRTAQRQHVHALTLFAVALCAIVVAQITTMHNLALRDAWYAHGAGACTLLGGALVALASHAQLPQADTTGRRWFSGAWALLPYVPTGLAFTGFVYLYARHGTLSPVLTWTLLTTVGLASVRQFLGLMFVRGLLAKLDEQQVQLQHQAHHDVLTGLPNRAAFYALLTEVLAAAGPGTRTAALMIDLDDFKPVNDTFGHAAGDALLVEVGARLAGALRGSDLAARFGGDEFVVLLPELDDDAGAEAVAARILDRLARPIPVAPGCSTGARASIGVGIVLGAGHGPDSLLQQADAALYDAKAAGKGSIRRHHPAAGGDRPGSPAPGSHLRRPSVTI